MKLEYSVQIERLAEFYFVDGDHITIMRVIHGRMDIVEEFMR
jgi:plasmid stabilization system protein ParE